MALLFRNVAIFVIPALLICFSNCSGMSLRPELLFALKACAIVCVSSAGVICWAVCEVMGVNCSSGKLGSWNNVRLCSAKACSQSADMSGSQGFSIFQNCLGLYLRISGMRNCNLARFRSQHFLYFLYAYCAGLLVVPYLPLHYVQYRFASRHSSLYLGAMCFSHLFRFLLAVMHFFVMTSAFTASSIRNASIFSALLSLSSANLVAMSSNPAKNCGVAVCARHQFALVQQSSSYSPGIHLHTKLVFFSSGGGDDALSECGVVAQRSAAVCGTLPARNGRVVQIKS